MNAGRDRTGQFKGIGGLKVAVEAVTREDQYMDVLVVSYSACHM